MDLIVLFLIRRGWTYRRHHPPAGHSRVMEDGMLSTVTSCEWRHRRVGHRLMFRAPTCLQVKQNLMQKTIIPHNDMYRTREVGISIPGRLAALRFTVYHT